MTPWPGSVIELLETIGPLTDPTAHGGGTRSPGAAVPARLRLLQQPTDLGWDASRTARAWAELMNRLGYSRYVAQGGDGPRHGPDGPPSSRGFGRLSPEPAHGGASQSAITCPESEQERAAAEALATFRQEGFGYFLEWP